MTLRHDDFVIMMDPSTNLTWIEAFLSTTDHLDLYTHRWVPPQGKGRDSVSSL